MTSDVANEGFPLAEVRRTAPDRVESHLSPARDEQNEWRVSRLRRSRSEGISRYLVM